MRPLGDYTWRDWRRLRPVTHWLKTRRYDAQREAYVRRAARTDIANLPLIQGRRVLTSIAFEDPEAIEMQAQLIARFVPDVTTLSRTCQWTTTRQWRLERSPDGTALAMFGFRKIRSHGENKPAGFTDWP